MVADERDRLIAAEQDIDPLDRAVVEFVVKYGAKELGVQPPRVRFFKSPGV